MVGGVVCGGQHNKLLHNSGVAYCHSTATSSLHDKNVLFEVQEIDIPKVNMSAIILFDNSSSATMVTHEFAALAGLSGVMTNYMLKATGFPLHPKSTLLYKLQLEDRFGGRHEVEALGIDEITDIPQTIDLSSVSNLFPDAPAEVWSRPGARLISYLEPTTDHYSLLEV